MSAFPISSQTLIKSISMSLHHVGRGNGLQFLAVLAFVIWSGLSVAGAEPKVLFHDTFDGEFDNTLNDSYWEVKGEVALNELGFADFRDVSIVSAQETWFFSPDKENFGRVVFQISKAITNTEFGLFSADVGDRSVKIGVRNDILPATHWLIGIQNGSPVATFETTVTREEGQSGTWEIRWMVGRVLVFFNDAQVFDSAKNPPTGGGLDAWAIPEEVLRPFISMYTPPGLSLGLVDDVLWEINPVALDKEAPKLK